MKKIIMSLFGCLLSLQCCANYVPDEDSKLYVKPDSIYVSSDSIYIDTDGNLIPIGGIAVDENGIYALLSADARIGWCPQCNRAYEGTLRDHLPLCPANKRVKL